ncbi:MULTISPECIES: aspartate kinase [Sporosarcina]|uniref:amino acid kinase family protein n=1 Tax=Sporosarcina TaxID=1569 RepID=UPI00058CB8FF|nr:MULTISPECIES: aspartate kinase [Sporosarcina]WJY28839.1 aspartate kinase [Sporosarcina sp. 0.2-SM1T-5]
MIIQKFGGAAMKDRVQRRLCIERIREGLLEHGKAVVVVSAIGRQESPYSTDRLLSITPSFHPGTAASDLAASCGELLASAVLSAELEEAGIANKVMHSRQSGIFTEGEFGNAAISRVETSAYEQAFKQVPCVIIPGFQGISGDGEYMTLGRGGSDLTAVVLASCLNARHVEFFKDVPGVMTADPRRHEGARKLEELTIDQFLPLLQTGHPIIQQRAADYAKKTATPLYIRGIAGTEEGTWVHPAP